MVAVERRAARHRLHGLGRRAAWADDRHFRRAALATPCARSPTTTWARPISSVPATSSRSIAKDGGVLMRSGHTEAAVDLCRLAGLPPVGVICELANDDGTVMKGAQIDAFAETHGLQAHLGRRSHRLSPGAREARRADRDVPGRDRVGAVHRLCLFDAVRQRAAHRPRPWPHRRRHATCPCACTAPMCVADVFEGGRTISAALQRFVKEGSGRSGLSARRNRRRADDAFSRAARRRHRRPCAPANGARSASARRSCGISASSRSATWQLLRALYIGLSGFGIELLGEETLENQSSAA